MSETLGMSDKQQNGLIIDMIEDFEEIRELLESDEREKALKLVDKKIEKNRKKLESQLETMKRCKVC